MRYRNFKASAISISGLGLFFLVLHYTDKDIRSELEGGGTVDFSQRKLASNGENADFGEDIELHKNIEVGNDFLNMEVNNAKLRKV